jgi:hypothetical protein
MAKNSPKRPFFSYSVKVKVLPPKKRLHFCRKKIDGFKKQNFYKY